MEIKQASGKEQAALQPLWEFATKYPPGTQIRCELLTGKERSKLRPGTSPTEFKLLRAEERSKISPGTPLSYWAFKLQQLLLKRQSLDSYFVGSGSKQTSAGHVVAVGLSPEDLLDPTRIESLLASMRQHPDKAAAAVNLVTGMGQNISDAFKLVYPTFTPAVAGPVAGLAIIGSSANFWQEMLGDDTMGKVMKGTVFVANTVDFLTITGIIPDGGTPMRIACIAARSADAAYDKFRKIKEPSK
jgi:hypothetical protein